jgi:cell fate regulator YaaT (PSP1 superfamily)
MRKKFGIKFRKFARIAPIKAEEGSLFYKQGDHVVVDTNRGFECGEIVRLCPGAEQKHTFEISVNKVKNLASKEDLQKLNGLEKKEEELLKLFNQKSEKYNILIKLVGVELLFDGHKVYFHYRVIEDKKRKKPIINIRPLNRELNTELGMKVEIREVGVRGEAKIIGGLGECGNALCCTTWLHKSKPITVKMAKEQGLAINISKLSGVCGRLKCCLQYEKSCYRDGQLIDVVKEKKEETVNTEFDDVFKE